MFKKIKLTEEQQKYITPLIDKSQFDDLLSALKDFKLKNEDIDKLIDLLQASDTNNIKNHLTDEISKKELDEFEKILHLLTKSFKIKDFKIQMNIVRGLDYYKGLVFEIDAPVLGAEKQLCGGGAYELISMFGGTETPSAGFAIGFDRTVIALEAENYTFPQIELDAYIIPLGEELIEKSLQIAQQLRSRQVRVDIDLMRRGVGKSLKYASSINAKKAIIIGIKEIEQDSVTVRDMKSGEQNLIKILEINEIFK
jgi:histidyl-tRNA synthetase